MARSRNIKPGFFMNDELAELPTSTRLLAVGLPCIADREGRIKDRPRRIKAELLPYDDVDINAAIDALNDVEFILRYEVNNIEYIQIVNFLKHQHPHRDEKASTIPASCNNDATPVKVPDDTDGNTPDSLNLITDSLTSNGFDAWWAVYPKKVEKKKALEKWNKDGFDKMADHLIADVKNRVANHGEWIRGFVINPTTYLNQECIQVCV